MATLEKIRNRAGLLVGAVGLALFAFIIGDGLRSGSTFFQQSKETVLVVDGDAVKIDQYSAKIEQMTEIYSMQMGGNLTEEQQAQLRESVFESMVREMLLDEEGERLGFTVTSNEMFDMVQGENISPMIQQMPMFHNENGQFDREALMRYLRFINSKDNANLSEQDRAQVDGAQKYWFFIEQNLRQQKMEEKFGTLIGKAIVVNKLDAQANFEESQGSVDFEYVTKNYASIPDSAVTVSNAEIEKLYKSRKEGFKQEPAAEIKYISLTVTPSEEDYAKVETEIEGLKRELIDSGDNVDVVNENSEIPFYDAFQSVSFLSSDAQKFVETAEIGDVQGPVLVNNTYHVFKLMGKTVASDSIRLNEMTMPPLEDAVLKNITDSLVGVIKGGKAFADLATELSGGRSNGDAGWLTDEQLLRRFDDKFRNTVYAANVNEVFVLKSTRGTHIVQVVEKTKPVDKYKIADLAMDVEPSNRTTTDVYTKLSQYVLKNNKLDSFEAEASAAGYMCSSNTITPNQPLLAGIPSTRPLIRWAFDHKKGDMSEIFECDGYRYVVAMVENQLKKGYRPINSVADMLRRELINDKKAETIMAEMNSLKCDSLSQCAEQLHTVVQSVNYVNFATPRISGIGAEPALNAQAPTAELNKISGPVKGNGGVYLFKVTQKHPSTAEFNLEQQKQTMAMQNSYYYMYQSVQALRDKAEVEDYRIRFY